MVEAPVGYQCPDCVDKARKEFKMGAARRVRTAAGVKVTPVLIGIIGLGYLAQTASEAFLDWALLFPPYVASGQYYRLFTVALVHGGLMHLLVNMLALWNLGSVLEQAIGRGRYLALFMTTLFAASATSYAFGEVMVPAVGASGAIFGVFGGLLAYLLRRRHTAAGRAAFQQLLFWLAINVFFAFLPGIDWRAHAGGLVAGFVTGFALEKADDKGVGTSGQFSIFGLVVLVAVGLVAWRTPQIQQMLEYRVMFGG
jgi:membrane associated rhomboid family serine protease